MSMQGPMRVLAQGETLAGEDYQRHSGKGGWFSTAFLPSPIILGLEPAVCEWRIQNLGSNAGMCLGVTDLDPSEMAEDCKCAFFSYHVLLSCVGIILCTLLFHNTFMPKIGRFDTFLATLIETIAQGRV